MEVQAAQIERVQWMISVQCLIWNNALKNLIVYSLQCPYFSAELSKILNAVSDKISAIILSVSNLVGKIIPKGTTLLVAPTLVHISAEVSFGRINAG